MSRNTARLFRPERRAISAGLSKNSTSTKEKIKSISSVRDLLARAVSICSLVFPRRFIFPAIHYWEKKDSRHTRGYTQQN